MLNRVEIPWHVVLPRLYEFQQLLPIESLLYYSMVTFSTPSIVLTPPPNPISLVASVMSNKIVLQ